MSKLSLSWSSGVGAGGLGGNKINPEWSDIEEALARLTTYSGTVTLDIVQIPDIGPQSLQVRGEQGKYVIMLGELDENDHNVRTFTNMDAGPGKIEILGDRWDSRIVCLDINVVTRAFREFFDTRNVSLEILD